MLFLGMQSVGLPQEDIQERSAKIYISQEEDMVLEGVWTGYETWFKIPYSVEKPTRARLHFVFNYSDVLLEELSTFTVVVNDVPVKSSNLVGRDPEYVEENIIIEGDMLKPGMNSFRISLYAQSHQNVCEDIENPANWYVVSKESFLEILYYPKYNNDLKYFPEPFTEMGAFSKKGLTFVLPKIDSVSEIELYANTAKQFGTIDSDNILDVYCLGTGIPENKQARESNLVVLGEAGSLPFNILDKVPLEKDRVAYSLTPSPWSSDATVLSIYAPEARNLRPAVEILASPDLKKELKGKVKVIDPYYEEYKIKKDRKYFYKKRSLETLGYPDQVIRGSFYNEKLIYFTIPPAWRLSKNASINFILSTSPLLDPDMSEMSVFVNGQYAGSTKLYGERKRPVTFSVNIPQAALDKRSFDVLARFYLDINQEGCERRYPEKAWVIIHKTSFVDLPHSERKSFYLQDFPGQYLLQNEIELPLCVIPDQPTYDDLTALLRFSYALGLYPEFNQSWLEVKKASEVTKEDKERNLVVIGLAQSNTFFYEINPELPISFSQEDSKPFISKLGGEESLDIPTDYRWNLPVGFREEMGCIELISSFWNAEKTILIITGTDKYLYLNAVDVFNSRAELFMLDANIAIINDQGVIFPYKTFSEEQIERIKKEALMAKLPIFLGFIIAIIFIIVIIVMKKFLKKILIYF